MMRSILAVAGVAASALLLGAAAAPPAQARVFVGVGIGVPGPFYAPYYAPPPVVYAPPPVVYATPPTTYIAPPVAAPAAAECREYQTQTIIDGRPQPSHGTACRQPDGSWRIVN